MIPYENYCAALIDKGATDIPTREEYVRMYSAPIEEPVVMTATTAKVKPTLRAHEEQQPKKSRAAIGRYRANGLSA